MNNSSANNFESLSLPSNRPLLAWTEVNSIQREAAIESGTFDFDYLMLKVFLNLFNNYLFVLILGFYRNFRFKFGHSRSAPWKRHFASFMLFDVFD